MSTDPWPGEWLRGVLDVCVLAVLAEGSTYGYAITARLDELGLGAVKGGTLYPLLARLEQAELVTTQWQPGVGGPGRKYFALTAAGRAELERRGAAWRSFAALTSDIVDPARTQPRPATTGRTDR
ncbi:PadR family transcriptional regulator [Cellulomonas terrae]|uniref:PadR family transcriptional regulator n=1 Tax=Cellulomonas terrae TaxID=311234 RepID=A0A511JLL6_9CELL|nr:PadR family transcriptional regulator [Cellulomonas terrae]GEL98846.1 PadR family transcriptional regulator [Cellulomonas terrae]